MQQFTELLPIEPFDLDAAIEFGKIQGELKRIGKPTGELDVLIAAVARSRQDILVTSDGKPCWYFAREAMDCMQISQDLFVLVA